jgi:hypothetical protein
MRFVTDGLLDTWMQPFGERYVEDYNITGKQRIDIIFQNLTSGQA